ncbi:MAG: arsenate reductase ArsC [Spirochaetales bacterium]|nr:arsenate reductase ArsC [Spirochaetales bacterium]
MEKAKVLFICVHNSARSQMAEEYLRKLGSQWFDTESAGLHPGEINPLVAEVLKEDGIDIYDKKTQSVKEVYERGEKFSHIITVCDRTIENDCPIYPQPAEKMYWSFPDPEKIEGDDEEKKLKITEIRDVIKMEIKQFIDSYTNP